jgi:hypothetical protein
VEDANVKLKASTYPLRLPGSLKKAVEELSKQDGTSINQFVVMAVAEKVSALTTAEFFEQRRAQANRKAFRRILDRQGGKPPRAGDELPE